MSFESATFLFILLPVSLLVYDLVPGRVKSYALLLASLTFYAFGEPLYLILILVTILFTYICGYYIGRCKKRRARRFLIAHVVVVVAGILFFRYGTFRLDMAMPVGIVVFTLQAISYTVDVYRREVSEQRNLIQLALYLAMFPRLIAGPIATYQEMNAQLASPRKLSLPQVGDGAMRFVKGLFMKVILADQMGFLLSTLLALSASELSVVSAWLTCLCCGFYAYFTFRGFSEMAIGLGRMFGYTFQENFRNPFLSESMMDFWQRFNLSLSRWFDRYVYQPLGAMHTGVFRNIGNILFVWMLMGLWYGTGLHLAVWGLYGGVLVLLEGYLLSGILEKIPRPVKVVLTNGLLLIGWVFFCRSSVGAMGMHLGALIGMGGSGFFDATAASLISSHALILIAGILFAVPWPGRLYERFIYGGRQGRVVINGIVYGCLFLLCAAYVVAGA